MNIAKVSRKLGIPYRTVYSWIKGTRAVRDVEIAKKLSAEVGETSEEYLLWLLTAPSRRRKVEY